MVDETNETQQQQTQQQEQHQQQRQQQKPEEKTHFSLEYVQELRAENAKYRTSAKEAREQLEAAQNLVKQKGEEADQKVHAATKAANDRIIRAELKAVAIKAGMVDLDGLKLADLSSVVLGDDGEVTGAEDLMTKLKEAKPYLFAEPAKSTTNTEVKAPPKKEPGKFNATKATSEELKAKAKELGINIKI